MNIRLFFLKKEGWFEAELTEKLLHANVEDLIRWAYAMMERNHYRNYLITEMPLPCPSPIWRGENARDPAEPMNSSTGIL
jgi:hypothetical protein